MNDDEIIGMFWQRNQEAINAVSEKYGKLCGSVAYNILKNKEDAGECVNDTYLRAWNTIPPQKPKALAPFLAKISRNLALDKYRFNHRKKEGCLLTLRKRQRRFLSARTPRKIRRREKNW